jgi:hypothetical protein
VDWCVVDDRRKVGRKGGGGGVQLLNMSRIGKNERMKKEKTCIYIYIPIHQRTYNIFKFVFIPILVGNVPVNDV